MTEKEILDYGTVEQNCKIGRLYFGTHFFYRFVNKEEVDVRSMDDDMHSLGKAKTIQEVKEIEKKYFQHKIERYKQDIETLECLIENYYAE